MKNAPEHGSLSKSSERRQVKRKSTIRFMLELIVILIAVVLLFGVAAVWRSHKSSIALRKIQAINNARQVYLCMCDFESDFGHFPDDSSARIAPEWQDFRGAYSNDYLGQLHAGGYTRSEEIFYARDARYSGKPDDNISAPSEILKANECGFSYVMVEQDGIVRGLNLKDQSWLPLFAAPLVDTSGVFESESFDHQGVYLRLDGAARSERLKRNGKIMIEGYSLFEAGESSLWGRDLNPVILLPER